MMLVFVVENLLYPDALIDWARLKAGFSLCSVLSEPMNQAASNKSFYQQILTNYHGFVRLLKFLPELLI